MGHEYDLPDRLWGREDAWSLSWKTEKLGKMALFFFPYVAMPAQMNSMGSMGSIQPAKWGMQDGSHEN